MLRGSPPSGPFGAEIPEFVRQPISIPFVAAGEFDKRQKLRDHLRAESMLGATSGLLGHIRRKA
jgi:hypothetical protein